MSHRTEKTFLLFSNSFCVRWRTWRNCFRWASKLELQLCSTSLDADLTFSTVFLLFNVWWTNRLVCQRYNLAILNVYESTISLAFLTLQSKHCLFSLVHGIESTLRNLHFRVAKPNTIYIFTVLLKVLLNSILYWLFLSTCN